MPGVSSPAVREASESQIKIFTPGVQDLPLQAFLPISVKLCCKGLLEMSKGIGIWLLGSMQGIPTPLWILPADRISCSVPVTVVGTSLLFGCWDMYGELLLLNFHKLHLRGQIVARFLSSLLTCVGP